jgi:hypothetical protein
MTLDFAYNRLRSPTTILASLRSGERVTPVSLRQHPGVTLGALPCGSRNLLISRHLRGYSCIELALSRGRESLLSEAHNPSCHSMLRSMVAL